MVVSVRTGLWVALACLGLWGQAWAQETQDPGAGSATLAHQWADSGGNVICGGSETACSVAGEVGSVVAARLYVRDADLLEGSVRATSLDPGLEGLTIAVVGQTVTLEAMVVPTARRYVLVIRAEGADSTAEAPDVRVLSVDFSVEPRVAAVAPGPERWLAWREGQSGWPGLTASTLRLDLLGSDEDRREGTRVDVVLPEAVTGGFEEPVLYAVQGLPPGWGFDPGSRRLRGVLRRGTAGSLTYAASVASGAAEGVMLALRIDVEGDVTAALSTWGARVGRTIAEQGVEVLGRRFGSTGQLMELRRAADPAGAHEVATGIVVWSDVAYDRVAGTSAGTEVDGAALTVFGGADGTWDTRVGEVMAGAAVSYTRAGGSHDEVSGSLEGDVEAEVGAVFPYVRWSPGPGTNAWGTLGYGRGEVAAEGSFGSVRGPEEAADAEAPEGAARAPDTRDLELVIGAAGGRWLLPQTLLGLDSSVVGDVLAARTTVADATASTVSRARLGWELQREAPLATGAGLVPTLMVGLRYDGGDVVEGLGAEVAAGAAYVDYDAGYRIGLRGRMVAWHGDDSAEAWGLGANVRFAAGENGRGLSFVMAPELGLGGESEASVMTAVDSLGRGAAAGPAAGPRSMVRIAYGADVGTGLRSALMTPYATASRGPDGAGSVRGGFTVEFERPGFFVDTYAEHDAAAGDAAVMVEGSVGL